jgi:hypothetical protein
VVAPQRLDVGASSCVVRPERCSADRDVNLTDELVIDFGPGVGTWQLANNNQNSWTRSIQ